MDGFVDFNSLDPQARRQIGAEFKRQRIRRALKRWRLARLIGFHDARAGCRFIMDVEEGIGLVDAPGEVVEMAEHLGFSLRRVLRQARDAQDARLRARHLDQPMWVGALLRHARLVGGWSIPALAKRAELEDARSLKKLQGYEDGEYRFLPSALRRRLACALGISEELLSAATRKEWAFYDADAAQLGLVVRVMPAIYNGLKFPDTLCALEVFEFARGFAARQNLRVCLTLDAPKTSPRALYIEPNGNYSESRRAPTMRLRAGRL